MGCAKYQGQKYARLLWRRLVELFRCVMRACKGRERTQGRT